MKGSTVQRGKTWSYIVDLPAHSITGRRNQKKLGGFATEGEAEAACAELITKINKGLYVEASKMTVEEYLNMYLEVHAEPNFKPTSYDTEKTVIEARIIPVLGKTKLQKLTPLAIKQFYAKLTKPIPRSMLRTFTASYAELYVWPIPILIYCLPISWIK